MDFTFFRIDNNARDRLTGKPVWVTEKADGITQARIAIVEQQDIIKIVPDILSNLIDNYSEYIGGN